jgi:TDG/mug DNA glycosylase family protein
MNVPRPPTAAELHAARSRRIPDVTAPALRVLFVGINPGLYSAAIGHHFGRPGNRFWPALAASGFTPRRLSAREDRLLLEYGLGLTNLVARTSARADELSASELEEGAARLARKVERLRPRAVAVLGVTAYRVAFRDPKAGLGPCPQPLAGALLWVLPNPSGLNAHHQLPDLARMFEELRVRVQAIC